MDHTETSFEGVEPVRAADGAAASVREFVLGSGGRIEGGLQAPIPSVILALVLGVVLAMLAAAQPARVAGRQPIATAVLAE